MPSIHEEIEVAVPPEQAYDLWADFGRFHEFVKNVERVERHGQTIHWVVKAGPSRNEWDAEILVEERGRRIAWRAAEGPIDTDIRFTSLPGGGTRVVFHEEMHDSLLAQLSAITPFAERRARDDLERYRHLLEDA